MNATSGALYGAPTASGTFNITVTVKDSGSPQQTASKVLTLTVASAAATLSITSTAFNPSTATVGTGYSAVQAMAATGGTGSYTWSITGQPSGMSMNATSGALYGAPTASGTFNITVTVKDSGSPQQTASKVLTLTVH
jgi:P2-related tail formation protein